MAKAATMMTAIHKRRFRAGLMMSC